MGFVQIFLYFLVATEFAPTAHGTLIHYTIARDMRLDACSILCGGYTSIQGRLSGTGGIIPRPPPPPPPQPTYPPNVIGRKKRSASGPGPAILVKHDNFGKGEIMEACALLCGAKLSGRYSGSHIIPRPPPPPPPPPKYPPGVIGRKKRSYNGNFS